MGSNLREFRGGCHCGAVRFRFEASYPLSVILCNCSICSMTGFQHVMVPHADMELLNPAARLTEYTFNTGAARHWFCETCGIKSYYQPRSHPDAYSVSFRCLDDCADEDATFSMFDGANWEDNIDELRNG